MAAARAFSDVELVNGSTGDPVLYLDYPGGDNALLFDAGENAVLTATSSATWKRCSSPTTTSIISSGCDRIVRANIDRDKILHLFGPVNTIRKVYDRIKSYEYPFFPFQKIVLKVHGVAGRADARRPLLECTQEVPRTPEVDEAAWTGRVVLRERRPAGRGGARRTHGPVPRVRAGREDRLPPGPAEARGRPAAAGRPWVQEALRLLRAGADPQTRLDDQGRAASRWRRWRSRYFTESPGGSRSLTSPTRSGPTRCGRSW